MNLAVILGFRNLGLKRKLCQGRVLLASLAYPYAGQTNIYGDFIFFGTNMGLHFLTDIFLSNIIYVGRYIISYFLSSLTNDRQTCCFHK